MPAADPGTGRLATNRKAPRDYHIQERLEAGIELTGPEVKSVRAGGASLAGSFAKVEEGQVTAYGIHVAPYAQGNRFNPPPERPRRLLLRRKEIDRLLGAVTQKGFTLVPLALYTRKRWIKVELGLCRGKQDPDKRETLKRKAAEEEARRSMARAR
jgi:SsrA-binding protein